MSENNHQNICTVITNDVYLNTINYIKMKDRPITIRLTDSLIKEIDDLAKIEKRSRNNMLQIIIETYFLKTKKHDN